MLHAILVQAFYVSSRLDQMAKTAEFHGADSLFMSFIQKLTAKAQYSDQLQNILDPWSLRKVDMPGDVDCQ